MKNLFGLLSGSFLVIASTVVAESGKEPPGQREDGSWGAVTSQEVTGGFNQGEHASDPSGDGHGPTSSDEPRAGLANVVSSGDLSATMDALGLSGSGPSGPGGP
ncbi:hypothetical protein [Ruegeria marina]|uniref:Uncharacterized protein n=1 Tax=Ruegeria marina TaxID=639004 RepID=A0A1G6Z3T7_9RHOB|nr:hypothetical protein [Ruegeria marina]SDD97300.1 hypothetical protein SAMN04488239_11288 [Ruegeria marina]